MEQIEEGYDEDFEPSVIFEDPMKEEIKQSATTYNDLLVSHYGNHIIYSFTNIIFIDHEVAKIVDTVRSRINRNKQLNIMVCGAAGIGKTSFIKLFLKKFNHKRAQDIINSVGKLNIINPFKINRARNPEGTT